jgi:putative DNA primase/helicase
VRSSQRAAIPKWVTTIYARAAKHLGTYLARLASYLTDDTRWRGALRYNRFTQAIEVASAFPPQLGQTIAAYRTLDEIDTLKTLLVVNASGFPKATYTDVWRAIMLAAEGQGYHPLQDYLNGLVWDEIPRLDRLFLDYFPGRLPPEDNYTVTINGKPQPSWRDKWVAYFEATGPCFMIGAVARAMEPGSKVDSLPIFVSGQRYHKGLGLQALTGNPAWFTDDIPVDVVDKDAKDALVGKWIVELAEMPHLRRDVERFKAFVSRQTDRYRRAYDRLTKDWPRQATLVGTSNDLIYLDTTGNRRFWAIPLAGRVDVAKITADRDQLWAEATHRWKNKESWWLSDALEEIAAKIQAGYVDDDQLEVPIEEWIEQHRDHAGAIAPFEMAALYPMLREPLGLGSSGLVAGPTIPSKPDQNRVANCLKHLGFRKERRWVAGQTRVVWVEQI